MRLGIIGAGWMSSMCCNAIATGCGVQAQGVYARDSQKSLKFSERYQIPFFTDDVEALIHHKDIDAIYVATTNESHAQFATMAIRAGKSVLVEKPFALNLTQAMQIQAEAQANGCLVMEAMWSRFSPAMLGIAQLVKTGALGHLHSIKLQTGCILTKEKNARVYEKPLGGGALLDIGVYPLSIVQMLTEDLPHKYINQMHLEPASGVDVEDVVTLLYENGLKAEVMITCQRNLATTMILEGSAGRITCSNYVFAQDFTIERGEEQRYYNFSTAKNPYTYQLEHFAYCVEQGKKESYIMPMDSTCKVMHLLDECRYAAGYYYPQETCICSRLTF